MAKKGKVLRFPIEKVQPQSNIGRAIKALKRIAARLIWNLGENLVQTFRWIGKALLLAAGYALTLPLGIALGVIYLLAPLFIFTGGVVAVMGIYEYQHHTSPTAQVHDLQLGLLGASIFMLFVLIRHLLRPLFHDSNERVIRLSAWDRLLLSRRMRFSGETS
jgi:hypothetical protein